MRSKIINIYRIFKKDFLGFVQLLKIYFYILFKKKVVLCVGDSHSEIFSYSKLNLEFHSTIFFSYAVNGATATGIRNPVSKTNARNKILFYLKMIPRSVNIFTSFGEVDCGFLFWYKNQKYKLKLETQVEKAFGNYVKFINYVKKIGFNSIGIYNIPLPTLDYYNPVTYKWSLRKLVKVNIENRANVTSNFNKKLKLLCKDNGYKFIDTNKTIFNRNKRRVYEKYINKDMNDHHIKYCTAYKVLIKELKNNGYE